jgi:hypothetical protein
MDAGKQAASAAAELLAFYREPALRRPGYLHGHTPMPHGTIVFRLALGRFPESIQGLPQAERDEIRIAAAAFVRQACLWERATHYQVLCLEPDASPEQVREGYHLLIALIHPDRHDSGWPAGCAQRANEAYAVLSDAARRAQYDERLVRGHPGPAFDAAAPAPQQPPRRHRRDAPGRMFARFAVVAGVVAALFIVQAWWLGDASPEHSLLERAMPASGRWVRQVLPDAPRFIGAFDFSERLPPIEQPRRMASLASWMPAFEDGPRTASIPTEIPREEPLQLQVSLVTAPAVAMAPSAASRDRPVASVPVPAATVRPPVRLAQAAPTPVPRPATAAPGAPGRDQVEDLVALVVGYYEAGDADKLVGLFDPDRLGFWSRATTRNTFSDFFAGTRARRLRIDRLDWRVNGTTAEARGEGVVGADFVDGRPRLERRVPVELEIVLSGGEPRLARLLLHPLVP